MGPGHLAPNHPIASTPRWSSGPPEPGKTGGLPAAIRRAATELSWLKMSPPRLPRSGTAETIWQASGANVPSPSLPSRPPVKILGTFPGPVNAI